MKINILSILVLSSINYLAIASSPAKLELEAAWYECFKKCNEGSAYHPGNICLIRTVHRVDNTSNVREVLTSNRTCVAAYRHCLAKCRLDYKHALQNQK